MAYLENVFIEGNAGAVLDSAAGTPNSQAVTIQGNAGGVPVPISGTVTATAPTGTQTVTVAGTVTLAETPTVAITGTVTVAASGTQTVTVVGTSTVEVAGIAGTPTVEVAGILGTSTVAIAGSIAAVVTGTQTVTVVGTATVQVAGGTVDVAGTSTNVIAGIVQVAPTAAANTRTNPFFNEITDGTNDMGTMVAFGSNPGTALALNANVAVQQGTVEVAGVLGTSTVTIAGSIAAVVTGTQTVTVVGTSTVQVAGGTVDVAGTSTVTVAGTVTVAATGTQTVTVVGTSTVQVAGISAGTVAVAGTSTVEVAGIVGTSTVTIAGTVTANCTGTQTVTVSGTVVDIADGPGATAGTVASSSILTGLVASTATPTVSAGQQIAVQGDTFANTRVSPYGSTGSFATISSTATATGVGIALVVPAKTKWDVQSMLFSVKPSNTIAATLRVFVAGPNSIGNLADAVLPAQVLTNTTTMEYIIGPGVPNLNPVLYAANPVAAFGSLAYPRLVLGPLCTITCTLLPINTLTQTLTVQAIVLPD